CGVELTEAAPVYFDLGRRLGLAWLRDGAMRMPTTNHWQKQAVAAMIDDLYALQADLTRRVVELADGAVPRTDAGALIDNWIEQRRQPVERIGRLIGELRGVDTMDRSMVAVANRRLRGLRAG